MTTIWYDIRYGVRMLVKKPGFTAIALITLAIGMQQRHGHDGQKAANGKAKGDGPL